MKDLTVREVAALKPRDAAYRVGRNLYVQVHYAASGEGVNRSWLLRWMLDGKNDSMGLGSLDLITLAEARQKATDARKLLLEGINPREHRDAAREGARLAKASTMTFEECARRYVESHRAGWRNAKHGKQWASTLATYAYPAFGDLPVAAVDTGMVMQVLDPIWRTKAETAARVRGRIEAVLDWATVRQYRKGDNPARWKGHLDKLLPAKGAVRVVKHHTALPYAELPAFLVELRKREGTAALALEFTILTTLRTGAVIGARHDEIDWSERVWTVPAARMKSKPGQTPRDHRVPLCDRAIEILKALPRERGSDFVFIGSRTGRPLSNMAMLQTLDRMGRGELTTHGFRSTFKDWASETTGHPDMVVEMALAHAVGNKVEAAYRRGDLFKKRRRLMEDWSRFCASPPRATGDVIALRGAR